MKSTVALFVLMGIFFAGVIGVAHPFWAILPMTVGVVALIVLMVYPWEVNEDASLL